MKFNGVVKMTHHRLDVNKIQKWIADNRDTVFKWGVTDCCLVTSDFVKHMTGVDPAEKHRGHYTTEIGAKKALIKYGTVEESLDTHFKRVDYLMTQRSDIVLYKSDLGPTLGFKWSNGVVTVSDAGLVSVDVLASKVLSCWRITE